MPNTSSNLGHGQYDEIREGMNVVDLAGDPIGTVSEVLGQAPVAAGNRGTEPVARNQEARRAGEGFKGFLAIDHPGGPLYIPFTMVNRVEQGRVQIAADREALDTLTYGRRPNIEPS
jgi:hypothetical protein